MAQIWDYIAQYNPTGFYEDNRSKTLRNDYMDVKISAANRENEREKKIMALEDAIANGDKSKLEALGVYAPEKRGKMIDNEEKMVEYARPFAQAYMQASPENKAKVYGQIYGKLKDVMDVSDMPMQWNENVDGIMETLANSDPTKIQQERQAEIARQAQQDMLNRQISLVNYQRSLANKDKADQINYVESLMEAGKISPEKGLEAISAIKGVSVTPQTTAEAALDDYLKTGNPEALAVIQRQGEAARLLSTKNTSDSAPIQANRAYDEWEAQNPNATEEEKRDERFRLNIPNGSDKVWLEQEKQRVKDGGEFLVDSGIAENTEQANKLLGVDKNSPVGQALNQETNAILSNPVMQNKKAREAYLKKAGENIAKAQEDAKFIEEQKNSLLPTLIDAYKAAEDGTGLGVISGNVTPYVSSDKASDNLAKITTLINMTGPVMVSKLKAAGAGARSFDSEGERKAYLPNFDATQNPRVIKNKIKEFSKKMLGIDIEKEIKKANSSGETEVIDFTEYFGE